MANYAFFFVDNGYLCLVVNVFFLKIVKKQIIISMFVTDFEFQSIIKIE